MNGPLVPYLPFGRRQRPVRDASCCLATASSVRDRKLLLSQGVPGISKPGAEEMSLARLCRTMPFAGKRSKNDLGLPHTATHIIFAGDYAEGLGDTVEGDLAFQGKNGSQPNN